MRLLKQSEKYLKIRLLSKSQLEVCGPPEIFKSSPAQPEGFGPGWVSNRLGYRGSGFQNEDSGRAGSGWVCIKFHNPARGLAKIYRSIFSLRRETFFNVSYVKDEIFLNKIRFSRYHIPSYTFTKKL